MKYEDEYRVCFDHIVSATGVDTSIEGVLENFGVEITDESKFHDEMMKVFEKMHEEGIIKPDEDNEEEDCGAVPLKEGEGILSGREAFSRLMNGR